MEDCTSRDRSRRAHRSLARRPTDGWGAFSRAARSSAGLMLVLAACAPEPWSPTPNGLESIERQRGVSWVASRDTVLPADLQELADRGVNWIVQTPFGWQRVADRPELALIRGDQGWWGERDEGIARTTEHARSAGLKTLLKPHVWLRGRDSEVWRGDIAMRTEADWRVWFGAYREFMLHYAVLAERLGIEGLSVGTELHGTVHREAEWRDLIAQVRAVYGGKLTYSANWYREYAEVGFWDALDWIGIQGYFPLSDREFPTVEELADGWKEPLDALGALARGEGKPVVFTEIGYKSVPFTAQEPWVWTDRRARITDARAFEAQASAYQAFFEIVWPEDWVAGAYFWKWYPSNGMPGRGRSGDFTPQGKPAEEVLARWYRSAADG